MANKAEKHQVKHQDRLQSWIAHHKKVALESLIRFKLTPVASTITLAVLAIALALPGFVLSVAGNFTQLSVGLNTQPQIMLFLQESVSDDRAEQISLEIMLKDNVSSIELIDRNQGLKDFSAFSEFGSMLALLDNNPIPPVILVMPLQSNTAAITQLRLDLSNIAEVDDIVLDMAWVERLQAIIQIAHRFGWVLSGLLGFSVLLIVGNTIRMTMETRRDEILVAKLMGATDAWIRRPFLYAGFWYGLLGAFMAFLMIQLALNLIRSPINHLANLYLSDFTLQMLSMKHTLYLLFIGCTLGVLGGFISTAHHLKELEPE